MRNLTWYLTDYEPDLVQSHVNTYNTLSLTDTIEVHEFDPYSVEIDADDSERLREPGGGFFGEHVPKMKEFTVTLTAWLQSSGQITIIPTDLPSGVVTEIPNRSPLTYVNKIMELKRFFAVGTTGWFGWDDETSTLNTELYASYPYRDNEAFASTTEVPKHFRMSARVTKMDFMSKPQHHDDSVRLKISFRSADPYIRVGEPITYRLCRYQAPPYHNSLRIAPGSKWYSFARQYDSKNYFFEIELDPIKDILFHRSAGNVIYPEITMRVPGYPTGGNNPGTAFHFDARVENTEWANNFNTYLLPGATGSSANYTFDPYYFTFRGSGIPTINSYHDTGFAVVNDWTSVQTGSVNAFEFWRTPQVRLGTHPFIFTRNNKFTFRVPGSNFSSTLDSEISPLVNNPEFCHATLTFQPRIL